MAMEVRIFVLLVLSVILVSGYSNYRIRPITKSIYRQYFDKYRGYRMGHRGYPLRRPYVRSMGQFFGRNNHIQRLLPRFQHGYRKGDQYLRKGGRGVGIRPIPIHRVPRPLRIYPVRSFRPIPTKCAKYETMVCSPAPYGMGSGKCFSICRNGKPCYKPCACTCLPFSNGKFRSPGKTNLLPLGKKPRIPYCEKSHRLICSAQKYSTASDVLCASACSDGICPVSCNCQCVAHRLFGGEGPRGFQTGRRGGQTLPRRNFRIGGRGGPNNGFVINGGRVPGQVSLRGGFNGGGNAGFRQSSNGVGFGGGPGPVQTGIFEGGVGRGNRFRGGGGGGFRFENGIDNGNGIGFDNGLIIGGPGRAGGLTGGGGLRGALGIEPGIEFGSGLGVGGGVGIGNGLGIGGGAGIGNGLGVGGGAGIGNGLGLGGGAGIGNGLGLGGGLGIGDGLDVGGGAGIGGGLGVGGVTGIGSGGVGGGAGIGEGLGLDGGLGIGTELGLGGGVGFGNNLDGFSTDLGMGISNDVAGTDRDFRLFASNVPGQLDTSLGAGGAGLDQSIPLDFSQLQAIDRLDFPLDGSQGIPNLIEPESSLMDSIPELNGPQLIDPSLGVAGSGGLIAMEAPDLGAVGLDPTALMELGGLVGGPMDPIMDVGTGQGRSKSQKGSKKPKKVTETVDIKVDVIKKGGSKDKNKAGKSNKKGQNMGVNGPLPGPGSFPTGIQSAGPLPGEMVDPAMFLGGSAVGGRGGALSGNGAIFDGGIIDTAPGSIQGGGMPESQLPPIGILVDGPSGGIMNGPNTGGLPGGLGGPGNMDSGIGALGGIGVDAFGGNPDLQNGALGGMGLDALSASGTPGKGHSGIIGLEGGFQGNFDPQANDLGGLGLDGLSAVPMDAAGTGQMAGSGAGGQAFDPNALFDPVIQDGTGFNDQMSFLDPTQPNSGPVGEIPIMPDPQNGAGAASGGNINLDLSSLIPADMLGGLDLSGAPGVNVGGGVNEKGQGGPIDHGPSGGVIGLADMAPLGDLGGGAIGNQIGGGRETLDSCLSRGEQLWCDAKASWGSTPGVQGWCNSNCHKGACNFERCACSCISQAEYDFRAGGSAGTQKV